MNQEVKKEIDGFLQTTLRISPRIFFLFGALAFLATGRMVYIRFSAFILGVIVLVEFLKGVIGGMFSDNRAVYRPWKPDCSGCGSFPDVNYLGCIDTSQQFGMPSGHVATAAAFAAFLIGMTWSQKSSGYKLLRTVALLTIVVLVMISRSELVESCHTWLQIIVGALLGAVLGVVYWRVDSRLFG